MKILFADILFLLGTCNQRYSRQCHISRRLTTKHEENSNNFREYWLVKWLESWNIISRFANISSRFPRMLDIVNIPGKILRIICSATPQIRADNAARALELSGAQL